MITHIKLKRVQCVGRTLGLGLRKHYEERSSLEVPVLWTFPGYIEK